MSRQSLHRAPSVLVLATLAALVGCGDSSSETIDPTRVEKAIEVSVAEQSKRLSIVVCPTDVKREKDKTFICVATLARGQKYPFKVTQKDDEGNVRYEQAEGGSSSGSTSAP